MWKISRFLFAFLEWEIIVIYIIYTWYIILIFFDVITKIRSFFPACKSCLSIRVIFREFEINTLSKEVDWFRSALHVYVYLIYFFFFSNVQWFAHIDCKFTLLGSKIELTIIAPDLTYQRFTQLSYCSLWNAINFIKRNMILRANNVNTLCRIWL